MEQGIFNWLVGIVNILFGFILKWIWDSHQELRRADEKLAEKVSKIEVLVAGEYVTKDEFANICTQLFAKLDKISEKLDGKADK